MKKFFSFFILLFITLSYHSFQTFAHDDKNSKIIVSSADTLIENPIPLTKNLERGEHILNRVLDVGEELTFTFESRLKFNKIEWGLPDSTKSNEQKITKKFASKGNYFFYIKAFNDKDEILFNDSFMIQVGEVKDNTIILVDGEKNENNIFQVKRGSTLSFSVEKPSNEMKYYWDFGDREVVEGSTVIKQFNDEKFPLYIIIRAKNISTNIFRDTFIRLENDEESPFIVNTPMVKENSFITSSSNLNDLSGLLIFSSISFLIVIILQLLRRMI